MQKLRKWSREREVKCFEKMSDGWRERLFHTTEINVFRGYMKCMECTHRNKKMKIIDRFLYYIFGVFLLLGRTFKYHTCRKHDDHLCIVVLEYQCKNNAYWYPTDKKEQLAYELRYRGDIPIKEISDLTYNKK